MMNYIKRRFSTDLQDDIDPNSSTVSTENQPTNNNTNINNRINKPTAVLPPPPISNPQNVNKAPQRRQTGPSPSAPSSPTKNMPSLSAMLSSAKELISTNTSSLTQTSNSNRPFLTRQSTLLKDKSKVLLVIDDASHIDWSRYFRNKKIGDFEIRVEQVRHFFLLNN
jgi:hypothetical protein